MSVMKIGCLISLQHLLWQMWAHRHQAPGRCHPNWRRLFPGLQCPPPLHPPGACCHSCCSSRRSCRCLWPQTPRRCSASARFRLGRDQGRARCCAWRLLLLRPAALPTAARLPAPSLPAMPAEPTELGQTRQNIRKQQRSKQRAPHDNCSSIISVLMLGR